MRLYDFAFSPNSRKVRAVAYELGIPLELVAVDLVHGASRDPSFLALNPNGRVPVIDDDGFVLWESAAILRYLSAKREGALVPREPRAQADMDRWIAWQLAHLAPAMGKVAYERVVKRLTGRGVPDERAIAEGAIEFSKLTAILEAALDGRDHVAGPLSLADFALASHYSLASICGLDLAPFPRVKAWLARVVGRASMKRALAEANASVPSHDAE